MRTPFEILADFYDYQYQYFRYYLHRRLVFGDVTPYKIFMDEMRFNIFKNKDGENVGRMIGQTTLLGFVFGLSCASYKTMVSTDISKRLLPQMKKLWPVLGGLVAISTGVGVTYGISVNIVSSLRDKKDGPANHAIAAMLSFPMAGYVAKTNKLQWGIYNAMTAAFFLSCLKYCNSKEGNTAWDLKDQKLIKSFPSPNMFRQISIKNN